MNGLATAEAIARLTRIGPNALPERPPEALWRRFVHQFNSPLIFILLFALAFDLGHWVYEGSRGLPIDGDGNLYPRHALYVTGADAVFGTTVTTTPLIRFWSSPHTQNPVWTPR